MRNEKINLCFFSWLFFVGCASKPPAPVSPWGEPPPANNAKYDGAMLDVPIKGDLRHLAFAEDEKRAISAVIDYLKRHPEHKVQIQGHVNDTHKLERDLMMSEKWARYTQEYMLAQGVKAEQMEPIAYGSEAPLVQPAESKANRRVTFFYLTYGPSTDVIGF